MSDNPIIQQGYLFSEEEYELLTRLMVSFAEAAKQNGNKDLYRQIQKIAVRIKHHVFAAQGVPDETQQRIHARIVRAFQAGNVAAARAGIIDMCTVIMRMDADPGTRVSELLYGIMANSLEQQSALIAVQARSHLVQQILEKLQVERAGFDQDGWPSHEETFDFILELLQVAGERVSEGFPPFDDDEDAEDAEEDDAEDQGDEVDPTTH